MPWEQLVSAMETIFVFFSKHLVTCIDVCLHRRKKGITIQSETQNKQILKEKVHIND